MSDFQAMLGLLDIFSKASALMSHWFLRSENCTARCNEDYQPSGRKTSLPAKSSTGLLAYWSLLGMKFRMLMLLTLYSKWPF